MDLDPTPQQSCAAEAAREFAETCLAPEVARRDDEALFDKTLFRAAGARGLAGLPLPVEWGGGGAGFVAAALAVEQIARVDPSNADTLSAHTALVAVPLWRFGDQAQKERWLRDLAAGRSLGAFCLTEEGAGSDVLAVATTARSDGDEYVLEGRKIFATNAGPDAADLYLVVARTADETARSKALTAFLVERGTPGLSFGPPERKMGLRGAANCDVVLTECRVPAGNRLGAEGQGFKIAMQTLDGGRIGIAALAVGLAQGALDLATAWAKERRQFGQPLSDFQATRFKLADMVGRIEAARLLTLRAAWLQDEGRRFGAEAAMAKLSASETAMWTTSQTVQIVGGRGYTRRSPAERMLRDAKICEIFEGTSEIQRIVIASHHLGK